MDLLAPAVVRDLRGPWLVAARMVDKLEPADVVPAVSDVAAHIAPAELLPREGTVVPGGYKSLTSIFSSPARVIRAA